VDAIERRLVVDGLVFRYDTGKTEDGLPPSDRRQMGNFPQAFSHVALVNTAYNFTRSEGPAEVRAGREAAVEGVG
jgi:GH15 family glucan-1,4-alpha-glucosidase